MRDREKEKENIDTYIIFLCLLSYIKIYFIWFIIKTFKIFNFFPKKRYLFCNE